MSKDWTPGPWFHVPDGSGGELQGWDLMTKVAGQYVLASSGLLAHQEADARLIASAPELYEALEALTNIAEDALGRLDSHDKGMVGGETEIHTAYAALRKARGETE